MSEFGRVAVVGAGLIGGSIARRLAIVGVDVCVVDPDPRTRELAVAAGLVVAPAVGADVDLVILANPLDSMAAVMAEVARTAPGAVIVDVGSVKVAAHAAAAAAGIADRYVGIHPMAGTERTGFEHSSADLLVGVTWALTHGPDTAKAGRVARFLLTAFEATVVVLGAPEHDRSVALVSHAPHALANALLEVVELADDLPAARHLAAGSFRDGTRVAGRNAARSFNMLSENAEALGEALGDVIALLQGYRDELGQPTTLRARLDAVERGAGIVRTPGVTWAPCADVDEAIRTSTDSGRPLLLRAGPDGFESAEA